MDSSFWNIHGSLARPCVYKWNTTKKPYVRNDKLVSASYDPATSHSLLLIIQSTFYSTTPQRPSAGTSNVIKPGSMGHPCRTKPWYSQRSTTSTNSETREGNTNTETVASSSFLKHVTTGIAAGQEQHSRQQNSGKQERAVSSIRARAAEEGSRRAPQTGRRNGTMRQWECRADQSRCSQ